MPEPSQDHLFFLKSTNLYKKTCLRPAREALGKLWPHATGPAFLLKSLIMKRKLILRPSLAGRLA